MLKANTSTWDFKEMKKDNEEKSRAARLRYKLIHRQEQKVRIKDEE